MILFLTSSKRRSAVVFLDMLQHREETISNFDLMRRYWLVEPIQTVFHKNTYMYSRVANGEARIWIWNYEL